MPDLDAYEKESVAEVVKAPVNLKLDEIEKNCGNPISRAGEVNRLH